jgi:hypothetical protein
MRTNNLTYMGLLKDATRRRKLKTRERSEEEKRDFDPKLAAALSARTRGQVTREDSRDSSGWLCDGGPSQNRHDGGTDAENGIRFWF